MSVEKSFPSTSVRKSSFPFLVRCYLSNFRSLLLSLYWVCYAMNYSLSIIITYYVIYFTFYKFYSFVLFSVLLIENILSYMAFILSILLTIKCYLPVNQCHKLNIYNPEVIAHHNKSFTNTTLPAGVQSISGIIKSWPPPKLWTIKTCMFFVQESLRVMTRSQLINSFYEVKSNNCELLIKRSYALAFVNK